MSAWIATIAAGIAVLAWLGPGSSQLSRLRSRRRWSLATLIEPKPDSLAPWLKMASGVLTGFLISWWVPGWLGMIVSVTGGYAVFLGLGQVEDPGAKRGREALEAQLAPTLEFLAVILAAGAPLRNAVKNVIGVSDDATAALLGSVLAHTDVGASDAEAWRSLAHHPVWGDVAADIGVAAQSGTALVETLRIHANEANQSRRQALEAKAKGVGVMAALPLVVCFLPAFLAIGVAPTIVALVESFLQR